MDIAGLGVFVVWLLAGFICGIAGLGGAMVGVPIISLFVPLRVVVPLSCLLTLCIDTSLTFLHFRYCNWRSLVPMLAGMVPGAFLGLKLLLFLPETTILASVGFFLLLVVVWQCLAKHVSEPRNDFFPVGFGAGFAAGTLGSSTSFNGPPSAAYAMYMGWPPRRAVGTLSAFYAVSECFTCGIMWHSGLYTPEVLHLVVYGIPGVLLGAVLAVPVIKRMDTRRFLRVLRVIIVIAAILCLRKAYF